MLDGSRFGRCRAACCFHDVELGDALPHPSLSSNPSHHTRTPRTRIAMATMAKLHDFPTPSRAPVSTLASRLQKLPCPQKSSSPSATSLARSQTRCITAARHSETTVSSDARACLSVSFLSCTLASSPLAIGRQLVAVNPALLELSPPLSHACKVSSASVVSVASRSIKQRRLTRARMLTSPAID